MFQELRKKWYEYQDKKEYEKHFAAQFPKEAAKKKKGKMDASVKKALVLFLLLLTAVIVMSVALLIVKKRKNKIEVETKIYETTTVSITETATVTETEKTSEMVTSEEMTDIIFQESVTVKRKRKEKIIQNQETEPVEIAGTDNNYNIPISEPPETHNVENVTKKQQKKQLTKETTTKKKKRKIVKKEVVNTVPSFSQSTSVLGAANTNLVINTVRASISGSLNTNMLNLARYMANNNLSDAQTVLNSLCKNTTLEVTCKTASVKANSLAQEDIVSAAEKLADNLGGYAEIYGIGVSAKYSNGDFNIKVIITIQK